MATKYRTPNPGSDMAIMLGCTCPILDNGHGRGTLHGGGSEAKPNFWVSEDCPLHGSNKRPAREFNKPLFVIQRKSDLKFIEGDGAFCGPFKDARIFTGRNHCTNSMKYHGHDPAEFEVLPAKLVLC